MHSSSQAILLLNLNHICFRATLDIIPLTIAAQLNVSREVSDLVIDVNDK